MKIWDDLRNYFYKKSLLKRMARNHTDRIITNLSDAQSVGIIYDSSNPDNDIIITKFAEHLRTEGKMVDILCFVNDTKTDHKADVMVFNKKSLSWYRTPQDEQVEKFAKNNFDLLLACFTAESFPLEYVAGISNANWRVGTYNANKTGLYDFMINVGGKNDLSYFLEQTTHFLNQVKV